jgi:hypothetical protein
MSTAAMVLRTAACGAAAAVLVACTSPGGDRSAATPEPTAIPTPRAAATPQVTSPRAPDEQERAAMAEILAAETAPERTAWLAVGSGNPEARALAQALQAVFEGAGWKVQVQTLTGMVLKPGVSILMAEEQPPPWTDAASRAMEASGVGAKAAVGYRPYYEEKKKEDPSWVGVPIAADQAFVIVIGPAPQS